MKQCFCFIDFYFHCFCFAISFICPLSHSGQLNEIMFLYTPRISHVRCNTLIFVVIIDSCITLYFQSLLKILNSKIQAMFLILSHNENKISSYQQIASHYQQCASDIPLCDILYMNKFGIFFFFSVDFGFPLKKNKIRKGNHQGFLAASGVMQDYHILNSWYTVTK